MCRGADWCTVKYAFLPVMPKSLGLCWQSPDCAVLANLASVACLCCPVQSAKTSVCAGLSMSSAASSMRGMLSANTASSSCHTSFSLKSDARRRQCHHRGSRAQVQATASEQQASGEQEVSDPPTAVPSTAEQERVAEIAGQVMTQAIASVSNTLDDYRQQLAAVEADAQRNFVFRCASLFAILTLQHLLVSSLKCHTCCVTCGAPWLCHYARCVVLLSVSLSPTLGSRNLPQL